VKNTRFLVRFFVYTLFACAPSFASAQYTYVDNRPAFEIRTTPEVITPGAAFEATVQSSLVDLSSAVVSWKIQKTESGKTVTTTIAGTRVDLTAPPKDVPLTIEVTATTDDQQVYTRLLEITPRSLTLIIQADSYTPPFYTGLALGTPGTQLSAQVFPDFSDARGFPIADSALTYTWIVDDKTLPAESGRGKSTLRIPPLGFKNAVTVRVRARSEDSTISGEQSATYVLQNPVVLGIENHPLFGYLWHTPYQAENTVAKNEIVLAAIPYFAPISSLVSPELQYEWLVNGTAVQSGLAAREIAFGTKKTSGRAQVSARITSSANYLFDARGGWSFIFSPNSLAR
jgi:hypothetical protein